MCAKALKTMKNWKISRLKRIYSRVLIKFIHRMTTRKLTRVKAFNSLLISIAKGLSAVYDNTQTNFQSTFNQHATNN